MNLEDTRITTAVAKEWAGRWRANPANTIKGYLIPQVDFVTLMGQENVVDIRAYMGIDGKGEHKLMLVGVTLDGKDLINDENGPHGIYDFTKPCPNMCDEASPLFHL